MKKNTDLEFTKINLKYDLKDATSFIYCSLNKVCVLELDRKA